MESRANAARAVGILRGKEAIPDLLEALQTKDTEVLFESLIALQKIGDTSAGPRVVSLLRDLVERVQVAAIETVGLLKTREAVPDLQKCLRLSEIGKGPQGRADFAWQSSPTRTAGRISIEASKTRMTWCVPQPQRAMLG